MSKRTTERQFLGSFRRVHRLLRSNWISSAGAALMTLAVMGAISFSFLAYMGGAWAGPYNDLLVGIVLPGVFVLGLVLVPGGLLLYRKSLHVRLAEAADRPVYLARAVVVLTALNFAAVATIGYGSTKYMSSNQFCGTACHEAMQPEHEAFLQSPHRRIACVHCHVAPGAEGFISSKLNGTRQLLQYVQGEWQRPIPKPVDHQLPAKDTCENCHEPEKYLGTKLVVHRRFREDEKVSGFTNVLLLRTGGTRLDGESVGIHWHVHPEAVVEYVAVDDRNLVIPWVRVKRPDGSHDVYATPGYDLEKPPPGEIRRMDCVDCHNRTGHEFEDPANAVDQAIAAGLIPRDLPFIKKRAMEALRGDWTREGARDGIRQTLQRQYSEDGALDAGAVRALERAADSLSEIWMRNVFPSAGVQWGTYPALDGHIGCFRCHNGNHKNAQGKAIFGPREGLTVDVRSNACDRCHVVLSENDEDPAVLDAFGLGR